MLPDDDNDIEWLIVDHAKHFGLAIDDTAFAAYCETSVGADHTELVVRFADASADNLHWVGTMGQKWGTLTAELDLVWVAVARSGNPFGRWWRRCCDDAYRHKPAAA
ncbi:MAG: hypothetical protein F4Z29_07465 [Gemmatimonadetes bacterium]|nr:hypothetical protein [Gemmatimonadota bacterium]